MQDIGVAPVLVHRPEKRVQNGPQNLRMLRSGFAILGDFQGESSRLIEFQNAQSQAEDMKLGIWEIDIKNSCGTLPCR